MVFTLWEENGTIKETAGGVLIECESCPCTLCDECQDGTAPASLPVTFGGVVEGTCGSCASWNQQHLLPFGSLVFGASQCSWSGNDPGLAVPQFSSNNVVSIPCEGDVYAFFQVNGADLDFFLFVYQEGLLNARFDKTFLSTNKVDCSNIGVLTRAVSFDAECDWTAATCTVG